mgnify:CR=1 FL=1
MKVNDILNAASRTVHRVGFKIKKASPEILVVAGIAGVVTSTVMACKATTKAGEILDTHNDDMDKIHQASELETADYTPEDMKKDTVIVYTQTAVKFIKLYGPSVLLGAASIACIVSSHNILKKRNIALAAAYAAVDKGFKDYRGRVVERFGEELDKELRYNIKAKEFEETTVDSKGKEKKVTTTVQVADPNMTSEYARFFDEACRGWTKDPEYNLMFLRQQQNWANELLKSKGHLFLNEVYDMLDIPRTKAGQIVGWVYDEEHPVGDNFIDFGIYRANIEEVRNFVNGYERTILLDFNVDGPILDMI